MKDELLLVIFACFQAWYSPLLYLNAGPYLTMFKGGAGAFPHMFVRTISKAKRGEGGQVFFVCGDLGLFTW